MWVAGSTTSSNLQPQNAFQASFGGQTDAFVGRLDTNGAVVYLTYLGGNGDDLAFALAVDAAGNAYVTGSTSSTNFPTASPLQSTPGGGDDVFVTKLNPTGTALVFSTYLGGSGRRRRQRHRRSPGGFQRVRDGLDGLGRISRPCRRSRAPWPAVSTRS